MEGGPETSVYIRLADREINLIGTYVSKTWEKLDNKAFRKLPTVIGIRFLTSLRHFNYFVALL
jgi:hypothetical protein